MNKQCEETFYGSVCKPRFESLAEIIKRHNKEASDRHTEISKGIKSIHEKLFVGNGGKPIAVRLELIESKTESLFGRWKYLLGLVAVLTASIVVKLVWEIIKAVE